MMLRDFLFGMKCGAALLAGFILGTAAAPAWATDYYVRPFDECPSQNGNGLAYTCATFNGGPGAWRGMTGVAQATPATSDVVYLCGTFKTNSADNATTMLTINWTNSGVILDGDCSAFRTNPADWDEKGTTYSGALLDGENARARAFDSGSGGAIGVTIRNVAVRNFTEYGILAQNAASDNWVIQHFFCDGSNLSQMCIRGLTATQTGWQVLGGRVQNCKHDCFYSITPATIDGLTGDEWGIGQPGDFIQFDTNCDGVVVRNTLGRTTNDWKQTLVVNGCGATAGNVTATGNVWEKRGGASKDASEGILGVLVEATSGTVTLTNNFMRGFRKGVFVSTGVGLVAKNNGIIDTLQEAIQCGTSAGNCTVEHNTVSDAAVGFDGASGSLVVTRDNIFSNVVNGVIDGLGDTESNNLIYGATGDACIRNGSPTACGTGNVTANPQFVAGEYPTTAAGLKIRAASPAVRAGVCTLASGCAPTDYGARRRRSPPDLGMWQRVVGDP